MSAMSSNVISSVIKGDNKKKQAAADAKTIHEANKLGGGNNKKLKKTSTLTPKSGKGLVTKVMGGTLG
uniref:Uncharacterized protein n=1 Tax=Siphoviridae sp. ct7Qv4 TaxID=2827786 RepID=A0A8S5SMT8_9CAUD|nr:MAG TPA: hypothetical protein [Siphoviridae sp. ct7Qv4]